MELKGPASGPLLFLGLTNGMSGLPPGKPFAVPYSLTTMARFADLRELFAKANEVKSGDQLAGIAAGSEKERVAAKCALADTQLTDILAKPLIEDEVTRLIYESFDEAAFVPIRSMSVGELREHIL